MDIYEILQTHNRMWSPREIIGFSKLQVIVYECGEKMPWECKSRN